MFNKWFKFEGKILNDSKFITFTKNHTDDDTDNNRTKNSMSPPVGGRNNRCAVRKTYLRQCHQIFLNIMEDTVCLLFLQTFKTD